MNISFSIARIPFYALFFSHVIFTTDKPQEKFECFSQLQPELQLLIFAHADNKTSFQGMNQDWSEKGSIRNSVLFTKNFCDIMYAKKKGQEGLVGILLCAAYDGNHEGVENILKNTGILDRVENRAPYHLIDNYNGKPHILDLVGIALHNSDKKLMVLLQKYKVSGFTPGQTVCQPTPLKMFCIAGSSDVVSYRMDEYVIVEQAAIEQCLKLSIDFDRGRCLKILLTNASKCEITVDRPLFERACVRHSLNALEVLLQVKSFDMNEVTTYVGHDYKIIQRTFLDALIENVENDNQYNEIIALLRAHGAKTGAEIVAMEQQEKKSEEKEICRVQ